MRNAVCISLNATQEMNVDVNVNYLSAASEGSAFEAEPFVRFDGGRRLGRRGSQRHKQKANRNHETLHQSQPPLGSGGCVEEEA
jgi:hypothetical protein